MHLHPVDRTSSGRAVCEANSVRSRSDRRCCREFANLPEGTDPHTVNSTRTKVCSGNRDLIASRWLDRGEGTEHTFAIAAGRRSSIGQNGPP